MAARPPWEERRPRRWPWVVLVLLVLGAGAFYLWGGSKGPLAGLPGLGSSENAPITVYKWQDADGAWHFADHAPPGVEAEAVEVEPGTVMPEPPPPPASKADGEGSALGHLPKTLIDRAHQAGETLEEQGRALTEGLDRASEP